MRSADLNNIIVNHAPNHHSKNPGWEYFPSSQIKCQVEAAQKKEIAKPTPPSIKIKTIELKAKYIDKTKPKHIFKKTDLKEIAKKKRDDLQDWIKEENNLRKGIQKQHKCKPAPSIIEDEPNNQWPEMNEDQQQENADQNDENQEQQLEEEEDDKQLEEQNEFKSKKYIDKEDQVYQQEEQELLEGSGIKVENQELNESQNNFQDSKIEFDQSNQIEKSQNSQNKSLSQNQNQSKVEKSINLQIDENKSEVKSIVSNSFVNNNSKIINKKSVNTSSLIFYKSQVADQMRSLMEEFE
ncbi:unnamed protein product [Paramecium sonneborni]|uniref:Uncharacterized protein n=1 Tax=Paramecium sonneborni TaxID=65129 RepID=A0A8S1PBL7_9CILI|nr:unnamed protein product [Paramecium sonneborni]